MRDFLGLQAGDAPSHWRLPITPDIAVGRGEWLFMFGGVGLAAGIRAMEQACERPVIWATAQFLSYARLGTELDLNVHPPRHGTTISQTRAVGAVGDTEVIAVTAALGSKDSPIEGQWVTAPVATPPERCRAVEEAAEHMGLHYRFDIRVAMGRYRTDRVIPGSGTDGRTMLWIRPREAVRIDAALLAIIADYVPSCLGHALDMPMIGNSLDNTIRFARIEQSEWLLCDVQIEAALNGFAHGRVHIFSDRGTLMATGSQTAALRGPPVWG